jgi:hypothetical protein
VKLRLVAAVAFPLIAASQTAVLQIKILEGEGGVHIAGSRSSSPLTVEVTDEAGKPVENVTISFQLPEDGPSGVFATGLRSEVAVTDARGRASVRNFRVNRVAGAFEIRVTAARDSARAGMLSRQYISGGSRAAGAAGRSRKKWYYLAAVAAGAAIGGVAASSGAAAPAPSASPTPPPLTVGAPTVSIGRP